jgi:hypothetical protein
MGKTIQKTHAPASRMEQLTGVAASVSARESERAPRPPEHEEQEQQDDADRSCQPCRSMSRSFNSYGDHDPTQLVPAGRSPNESQEHVLGRARAPDRRQPELIQVPTARSCHDG